MFSFLSDKKTLAPDSVVGLLGRGLKRACHCLVLPQCLYHINIDHYVPLLAHYVVTVCVNIFSINNIYFRQERRPAWTLLCIMSPSVQTVSGKGFIFIYFYYLLLFIYYLQKSNCERFEWFVRDSSK